ncbi:MAG: hypothetical protein RLZZ518_1328 [Actinomycetota bacterium]
MSDHYATLGVARTASLADIRRAYRARMRSAHPDSRGNTAARGSAAGSSSDVTRIAEAWSVLSSPARRAAYDMQLATGSAAGIREAGAAGDVPRMAHGRVIDPDIDRVYAPARFPWRFVLIVIGIGSLILVVLHIMGDPMPRRGIDGLISAGSCVDFDELGAAFEVPCDGPYTAVVRELVPFDAPCDSDTTQARDRQGMGTVCIEP